MLLRCELIAGLNEWAKAFVASELVRTHDAMVPWTTSFGDVELNVIPHFEGLEIQKEQYAEYAGLGGDTAPLHRYTFPDGRVYCEVEQEHPPLSVFPVVFLALQDAQGRILPQSLWPEEVVLRPYA